jgi:D-alanyl-D-alanine carboxypeptidase
MSGTRLLAAALVALACLVMAPVAASKSTTTDVRRGLEQLVAAPGGPPGAIATIYRDGRLTTLSAGRADIRRKGAPRATDHMRIASVSKAFSGAVALHLVSTGQLGLDDTIAERLPGMPAAWGAVTVRQLLNHTGGLPDYTKSEPFKEHLTRDPRAFVSPKTEIDWIRSDPLEFVPGTHYEYSNTDNVLIGLISEAVTGGTYDETLRRIVFGPGRLRQTSLPTGVAIPPPFIHGYSLVPGKRPDDDSSLVSPTIAGASGGIISTPRDLNAFGRADLALRFFDRPQQREQMRFYPGGESDPPGPGQNSAGLALFRYRTRCGTVFGHTGTFIGYAQFVAATADGTRAVTTSINTDAPHGKLLARLRRVQTTAVCAMLGR